MTKASGSPADSPQSSDLAGQMAERRRTIEALRQEGINPYDNRAPITHQIYELPAQTPEEVAALPGEAELSATAPRYAIAGRLLQVNDMGKAKFLFLRGDRGQMVQLYLKADEAEAFALAKRLDLGDFVWARGPLFKTRKEKRALRIEKDGLRILAKAIRPLPGKALQEGDKATDDDWRYRQRYADMIIRPEVADVFRKRAQIVTTIRRFFDERGYVEADTRVLQNTNGGAAARPFATHMNALNIDLFLRIATELDLKRLVVGGLERVYEIGRLFRNEGLSRFHNPEFTTIEFYQAYATYRDIMEIVEGLFETLALAVHKTTSIDFQEHTGISLKRPFRRGSMRALVKAARPDAPISATLEQGDDESPCDDDEWSQLPAYAKSVLPEGVACKTYGHALVSLFEHFVEGTLIQPTFVTLLPTEISPLARKNDKDPRFVDRFELFVAGREFANAFSELNDPDDQRSRFVDQVDKKAGGDHEAMDYDEDYCRALEYGLPPTGGCGIGIDRLVMLLTNQASIRDVIPFPILRPESHQGHEHEPTANGKAKG